MGRWHQFRSPRETLTPLLLWEDQLQELQCWSMRKCRDNGNSVGVDENDHDMRYMEEMIIFTMVADENDYYAWWR